MKIVVIGGTGLIGAKLVKKLRELGHEVIGASPSKGINTLTGEGLDEALKGASIVIDVANSPSFEDQAVLEFFETSGKNLIAAEARAEVDHHVALSVVGTDRLLESGYFRAKMAQEKLIRSSTIPYTIVRATQFFEFSDAICQSGKKDGEILLPDALFQPIASGDVVEFLAQIAVAKPSNHTLEIGGPEKIPLTEMARRYLAKKGDHTKIISDKDEKYFGVKIDDSSLTPKSDAHLGSIRYDEWLKHVQ